MNIIRQDALDLLSMMRVLTLATHSKKGTWTAPVYYVYFNKRLYFFSNPDSKHIKDSFSPEPGDQSICKINFSRQIAASVFLDSTNPEGIKGIQMQGIIKSAINKKDAVLRSMEYIKKYKIDFNQKDILYFFQQQYKAKLYCFVPDTLYFMDNSIKLGFRERVDL